MRRLLLAIALSFVVAGPVQAYTIPSDLSATLTVISLDAATVTVGVQQTGGAPTTLKVVNTCYAGSTFAGTEAKSIYGSGTLTFQVGPRKRQGHMLIPDHCWAQVRYDINGNVMIVLAEADTLP